MNKLPSPLPRLTGDRINLLVKKIKRGRREGERKGIEGEGKGKREVKEENRNGRGREMGRMKINLKNSREGKESS